MTQTPPHRPLVTVLDDEPEIRTLLADVLEEAGFDTLTFARARSFEAALSTRTPDVCLVDLGLPDTDGLTLVHRLALEQGAIVIIISGRAQVQDRVTGLELGADDYIIKPFDPAEVVARIRARLRSPKQGQTQKNTAQFADWNVDFDSYTLRHTDGSETAFSHAEGEVLRLFLDSPKRLISRAQMLESLGGATIYGAGYIFLGDVTWR